MKNNDEVAASFSILWQPPFNHSLDPVVVKATWNDLMRWKIENVKEWFGAEIAAEVERRKKNEKTIMRRGQLPK